MHKKTLILGQGYIGHRLAQALKLPLSSQRINSYEDVKSIIAQYKPKVLINCIGYVGKTNVDECDLAVDKTIQANTLVPILLGEAALRYGLKLVHISSGCIYHYDYRSQKPISENRAPDYYDLFYSRSKIYAEDPLLRLMSKGVNVLIARIRVPLDNMPHPKNLLTKLIKYHQVIDSPNSVTYIPDFIEALKYLIMRDAQGIFNIALKDGLYYPDMMDLYRKYDPDFSFKIIKLKELALNRTSLLLSVHKLEREGFNVRPVREVMQECIKKYVTYL